MRVSALTRGALVVVAAGTVVAGVAACSSNNTSSSPTATAASPTSSTMNTTCNIQALSVAIPQSAKVIRFACGSTGTTEIAAIQADPGKTVFWAKLEGQKWVPASELQDQVCGAASAGYSDQLLSFCTPKPKDPQPLDQ